MSQIDRSLAQAARAWPFEEARKLLARTGGKAPAKGYVLLETGYGPSGLPHIGTFGEVVRTTMVRQAFRRLSDVPARLFCFSDDMDGLRKVPDNVPNKEMLAAHLGKPLTAVPDPFSNEYPSFGAANNARLRAFLDSFGFEYEFQSATDWYKSGRFDKMLLAMLQHYDEVQAVMLPTLGEERQQTYSVFLPISPKTGRVLQVPVVKIDAQAGTIVYRDEDGTLVETPVTGGNVKLQWKADWAGRWFALDVDYEMYGKDLIPSAELSAKIVRILGGKPPEGFNYELFLDEEGKKISKSKGNGLSVEEWLRYAPPESLALYMQQQPRRAKRLYFDVIPRAVDDYLAAIEKLPAEEPAKALENAAWHIHDGASQFRHAAQSRERGAYREQGRAVAVPAPICTGSDAGDRALSRSPALGRGGLLPGFREGLEEVPAADGQGARRAKRSRRHLAQAARGRERGVHPERGLRGWQAPLRPGRAAPVVQDAL
jgi:lysyl-tRNA synthetase class 1